MYDIYKCLKEYVLCIFCGFIMNCLMWLIKVYIIFVIKGRLFVK